MDCGIKKIDDNYLDSFCKKEIDNYFGDWIHNCDVLNKKFINNNPFNHIVIDNFLNNDYAKKMLTNFPTDYSNWHKYCNPIEYKFAFDDINKLDDSLKDYFYLLSTPQFINKINVLTGIEDLELDPYLHGAGLHAHGRYGKLDIHLDYEKHPFSNKERQINIILFINNEWKDEWKGANELWHKDFDERIKKTNIKFNRAIIFKTNDISWHGMPEKILCPDNMFRKSLAYYYISPTITKKDENQYRTKATYKQTYLSYNDGNINKLFEIRSKRRITDEDIKLYCPKWSIDK